MLLVTSLEFFLKRSVKLNNKTVKFCVRPERIFIYLCLMLLSSFITYIFLFRATSSLLICFFFSFFFCVLVIYSLYPSKGLFTDFLLPRHSPSSLAPLHLLHSSSVKAYDRKSNVVILTKTPVDVRFFSTGGTIDVVAHKIRKDSRIRELFRATGGAWGGTIIDRKFQNLLEQIFGVDFIDAFRRDFAKDFVELLQVGRYVCT